MCHNHWMGFLPASDSRDETTCTPTFLVFYSIGHQILTNLIFNRNCMHKLALPVVRGSRTG